MALEQFIEISGVAGEASAPDVHSAIPVLGWSFGIAQPGASDADGGAGGGIDAGGGAGTQVSGPASFSGFRFSKRVDSSTPLLMELCARGTSSSQARLVVRSTGHRDPRVVVDLREVLVAEVSATFDPVAADLVEQVVLRFDRVWFGGAVIDRRGSSGQVNWFAWDVGRNRPAAGD